MAKQIVYTTATKDKENPFRKGTAKRAIFEWCLNKGEFTKEEFNTAVIELKNDPENGFKTVQSDAILPRAWWGELANKAEVIVEVE